MHHPYRMEIEEVTYNIDFGAEPLLGAEKEGNKIAVEVKSFVGSSTVNEFHKAVGQFNDYSWLWKWKTPNGCFS